MTTSIEAAYGSHVFVDGFLLNNQLTDFSFRPVKDGRAVANAPAPGKRPRSSMSPVIVFDGVTGEPILALGSPGGLRIVGYVAQALLAILDGGKSPQEAVSLPHVVNLNGATTEIEDVGWSSDAARLAFRAALEARGHTVSVGQQNSGLHVAMRTAGGWTAGIDPRREGVALGR